MVTKTLEREVGGWGEFTCVPGPPTVVNAPPLTPSPLSLVTSCPVYDSPGYPDDLPPESKGTPASRSFGEAALERWVNGFDFLPEITGPADGVGISTGSRASFVAAPTTASARRSSSRSTTLARRSGSRRATPSSESLRGLTAHDDVAAVENQWWTGSIDRTSRT